ncbi:hypothetical protein ACPRR5_24805, partial [Enterobacter asburiae]
SPPSGSSAASDLYKSHVLLGNAVASWVVSHRGGDCAPTRDELFLAHKDV